jgi:NAD-dependent deacetylase
VGTTLEVQPAASLLPLARSQGAAIVIVNNAPTALDSLADVVLRGSISAVLPRLVPAAG